MNKTQPHKRIERERERGSVLALSTFGMLAFLLATGLAVDISHLYLAKTELQNAADAAALAGASALNSSQSGIIVAADRAVQQMNNYEFNHTNVTFPRANVLFAVNLDGTYMNETSAQSQAANIRFVKVTTPQLPVGIFFAAMTLGAKQNVAATSTAGLSVPINTFCNFIPLSVIDYDIPLAPGNTYAIRAGTGNSPSPGNYQILAVAGRGGVDVEYGIGAGVDACAGVGETYTVDTKPGITAGKVRKGINSRFDDYQGSQLDPANEPPDMNVKENITYDDYQKSMAAATRNSANFQGATHAGVWNRRVVLIPIVKLGEYDQGRGTVRFNRFGAFFLKTKAGQGNGGDIQAEYIEDRIAVGKGTYNPAGAAGDPLLAVPVLYK